jgi:hypothetical protein
MEADRKALTKGDGNVKVEDAPGDVVKSVEAKPTYRSFKKKYRKMRMMFDQKMQEGENLYKVEEQALRTARRLAVENEYVPPESALSFCSQAEVTDRGQLSQLLDVLLDINNCGQIPPEKRFDLTLKMDDPRSALNIDKEQPSQPDPPVKALKDLLGDVPHIKYASAGDVFGTQLQDLQAGRDSPADPSQGLSHPPTFLTADDIDNYIWEADRKLMANSSKSDRRTNGATGGGDDKPPPMPWPSLAPNAIAARNGVPAATIAAHATRDAALRNPTSVYNWLRKHAPKTFLQDAEAGADKGSKREDGDKENGHSDERHSTPAGKTGRARGDRLSRGGSARTQRRAAAKLAEEAGDFDEDVLLDVGAPDVGAGSILKGKRKRQTDDDPGYRPKGGSSRPTKKKRKSVGPGGADGPSTPTTATATAGRKLAPRKSGGGGEGHARKPSDKVPKAKDKDIEMGDEDEASMHAADDAEAE